jgi:hypothetical protein
MIAILSRVGNRKAKGPDSVEVIDEGVWQLKVSST